MQLLPHDSVLLLLMGSFKEYLTAVLTHYGPVHAM
jgi:hypothetical protein